MKLLEQKEIVVALKSITKSVTVTRQRVQAMAEQAVAYSIIHGDISIGKMLLEAISVNKSLRKDSLVAYFEKYGNFAWMKADKTLKFFEAHPVGTLTTAHEALIVGAKWDEAKREAPIVSQYDMEALFRAFIVKMNKIAADTANTVENQDALATIDATFAQWSANKVLKSMKTMDEAQQAASIAAVVPTEVKAVTVENIELKAVAA